MSYPLGGGGPTQDAKAVLHVGALIGSVARIQSLPVVALELDGIIAWGYLYLWRRSRRTALMYSLETLNGEHEAGHRYLCVSR